MVKTGMAVDAVTATTAGQRVQVGVVGLLRWATRPETRRAMSSEVGVDLSPTERWVLGAIIGQGPVRVSDLATWQGVDKSTMTPQVRRLEDRGLVVRAVDENDRRAVLLEATDEGRRVVQVTQALGAAVYDEVLAGWSERDREALARLLPRFSDALAGLATGR